MISGPPRINLRSVLVRFPFLKTHQYSILNLNHSTLLGRVKMAATFPVGVNPSMPKGDSRFKPPIEFACFSYDKDHQFRLDDSSLKWYYPPQGDLYGLDLSRGFETFDKHDDSVDEHLVSLLKTIADHEEKTGKQIDAEFVTWRGMMTKIMAAPYDDEGFEMNATLYRDCIFIEENHSFKVKNQQEQNNRQRTSNNNNNQRRNYQNNNNNNNPPPEVMQFWGYKFETLCTLPRPWGEVSRDYIESRDSLPVSNKEQYCSVVRTGIDNDKHKIVLGGEVDCIWDSRKSSSKNNWVELKTSVEMRNNTNDEFFFMKRKMFKFWIQSFLLGVPKIAVGFRDRNGFLKRVQEFETESLPGLAMRDNRVEWRMDGCVDFLERFLSWLKETINDGVWRIRRQKGAKEIEVWRVEEAGHGEILTDEFMNWRIKLEMKGMEGQS
ncbi:dhp1-interacting protein [Podospora fimiseda]|uniref:Decapping nuclease n=1 Tax=Podospora fimiseda TaxID=252190 RepID=A0AAN7BNE0_9PEZI|nr:dhp1-interacting protein [Podospora fimiseda]